MSESRMLLPDGLSTNAYRILRLSANASSSEVHKAAERARSASALGLPPANDVDINLLGPLPQTDTDVRAAVSRLGNPAHRLKDRLFWFHQVPGAELPDPSAPGSEFAVGDLVDIIRRHDEALRGLFNAFHANLDDAGAAAWVRALRRWHTIVSDDSYWALSAAIDNRGGFEPRALPTEVDSIRSGALSFAAHGLLVEGRDAVNRNDSTTVELILGVLGKLAGTGSWAQAAQDELASQAVTRFTKLCREIRETGGGRVVREKYAAAANKIVTEAALDRFRQEVDPELAKLIQHFPPDHDLGRRVRESAAESLYGIAQDLAWADEYALSEALHEEALELAMGTPTAVTIVSGLTRVREGTRQEGVYGKLKPAKASSSHRTLYGFAIVAAGFLIWLAMNGVFSPSRNSYSHRTSTNNQEAHPVSTVAAGGAPLDIVRRAPSATTDNSGSSSSADLLPQIDRGRAHMKEAEAQLRSDQAEIEGLTSRINALASDIELTKPPSGAGTAAEIGAYNENVDTYNDLVRKKRVLLEAYDAKYADYDAKLAEDKRLVAEYNRH
jgi:hypothetical protein